MARYYDEEGYEQPRPRPQFNAYLFMIGLLCTVILLGIGLLNFRPELILPSTAPATVGNIGRQAPPDARSTNGGASQPRAQEQAAPDIAINAYNATSQARYDAAVLTSVQAPAPATPDLGPLPLNSAGAPVIDRRQQQQQYLALQLAEQERLDALNYATLKAQAEAEIANRQPDVSYEDAKALLGGRDPCSVPRANPHTCALGLYKPTPVR